MLVNVVKYLFVIAAVVVAVMMTYGKLFVFKKREPQFISDYCATMAGFLGGYSVLAIVLAWLFPSTTAKFVMLWFALAPFLIGLLVKYHTEKYYTIVQIILILISIAYVLV